MNNQNETTKEAIRRAMLAAFNQGNLAALDEVFSADMVDKSIAAAAGQSRLEGFKQRIAGHRAGLPDITMTIHEMVMDGDQVAYRWAMKGTHTGTWLGRPATNKTIDIDGMNLERLSGGKIVEHYSYPDMLKALQQLGLVPSPTGG
jgi:steroid delta-isomerase-like uncharacterized protein